MSRTVILSPHHDDVALFSAFNAIRYRAHIIVVLRSVKQEADGIKGHTRIVEETAAAAELGCTVEFWPYPDDHNLEWGAITTRISQLEADRFFAPAHEEDGANVQHNLLADAAWSVLPRDRLTGYLTYTTYGKSTWGRPVEFEAAWVPMKLRALACHASQASHAQCFPHFLREQFEYVA